MRIGVDLGGTKIEVVVLDDDGMEHVRRRVPTPPDYEATIAAIVALVTDVEAEVGARGTVGVGMPGTLSPQTGVVKNANSTWLIGRPFDRDLAAALGRDVRCANDANCLALSEARDGAGAGARTVFGVILGTGVGGGLVVNGRVLEGSSGLAGEWGHNPLPWPADEERPGRACYCGKRGCIETWLSGPSLRRDHRDGTGATVEASEIAAAASRGDPAASATLERYGDRLARALASVVNVLDPDLIVLGGGVSNIDALFADVPPRLPAWVFGGETIVSLRRATHGDSSGVRGAAWLCRD
jgi:fructokinase